jgi:hypothetical protein
MSALATPATSPIDIAAACDALKAGKITKAELISIASGRQTDTAPLLKLMVEGVLTMAEVSAIISAQQALAATPARQPGALHFKVSDKGAVSVYGLQARFPVTLYGDQWKRLLAHREQLEAFMAANQSKLSTKPAKS